MRAIIVSLLIMVGVLLPTPTQALPATPLTQMAICGGGGGNLFVLQPWYACLPKASDGSPKIEALTDILKIGFVVIDWLLKIAFYVAAGYMFYMIILMISARGNASKVATAALGIRDAAIGLVIAMISVAIVTFVSGAF